MFQCNCCASPRSYSSKKALYKHQRRYDPDYVDPRQKAAEERRAAYEANPVHCAGCNTKLSYEDVASGWKTKFCSQSCAATHNNIERAPFVCECCSPQRRFKSQAALSGHIGHQKSKAKRDEYYSAKRDAYAVSPKLCKSCSLPLNFESRRHDFCSQICNASFNHHDVRSKCSCCDSPVNDNKARCCSLECDQTLKHNRRVEKWLSGEIEGGSEYGVTTFVRRYLFEKHNSRCAKCGWGETNPKSGKIPLQVDHIDGNSSNNEESNLTLLCPNCHSLTPTFGALNRGNGRAYRRQRYAEGKSY